MKLTKLKKLSTIIITSLCLTACATSFQKIEEAYYQDHYLETLKLIATSNLKNKQIHHLNQFIQNTNPYLLQNLTQTARLKTNDHSNDNGLIYISDSIKYLQKIQKKKILIQKSSETIKELTSLLQEKTNEFIDFHKQAALFTYQQKYYRVTVLHLNWAKKYAPLEKNLQKVYKDAKKLGSKAISIQAFETKIVAPRVWLLTPKTLFTTEQVAFDEKDTPSINGLNIKHFFIDKLSMAMHQHKTDFLAILTDGSEVSKTLHYQLNGKLTLATFDNLTTPTIIQKKDSIQYKPKKDTTNNWSDMNIDYNIYQVEYGLTLEVTANIQSLNETKTIHTSMTVTDNYTYRDNWKNKTKKTDIIFSPDYLSLSEKNTDVPYKPLMEEGLIRLSDKLSKLILNTIDKTPPSTKSP